MLARFRGDHAQPMAPDPRQIAVSGREDLRQCALATEAGALRPGEPAVGEEPDASDVAQRGEQGHYRVDDLRGVIDGREEGDADLDRYRMSLLRGDGTAQTSASRPSGLARRRPHPRQARQQSHIGIDALAARILRRGPSAAAMLCPPWACRASAIAA